MIFFAICTLSSFNERYFFAVFFQANAGLLIWHTGQSTCGWLSLHHDIAQSAVGMWPLQNVVKCIVHITLPAPLKVVCNENRGYKRWKRWIWRSIFFWLLILMSSFIQCISVYPTALNYICAFSYEASFQYAPSRNALIFILRILLRHLKGQ